MTECDVCGSATPVTPIPGTALTRAVREGYDPFAMGSPGPTLERASRAAAASGRDRIDEWKGIVSGRAGGQRMVCDGCLPALRPFLDRPLRRRIPGTGSIPCAECGHIDPPSQWHCSACGDIQWTLIVIAFVAGLGLLLWAAALGTLWGSVPLGLLGVLFLWISVDAARAGLRNRRRPATGGGARDGS